MNIDKAIQSAFKYYEAGNLHQAEQICKKILIKKPNNVDTLYLLVEIYDKFGNNDLVIKYIRKVLQKNPTSAILFNNLGNVLFKHSQYDEAIICYRKALKLDPHYAKAHSNLGIAFQKQGQYDEAIICYRKALKLDPHYAKAHSNLGVAFQEQGQYDEAIISYQKALKLNPDDADAYYNLGAVLREMGQYDQAMIYYQKALKLNPDDADAYNNLGVTLYQQGLYEEAINCYKEALHIRPNSADAHCNLGIILKDRGKLNEAEVCFKKALQIRSDFSSCYSNFLCLMNYNSHYNADTIFSEHLQFAKSYAEPLSPIILPHKNDCSSSRRIKIAYISPDFRTHSVGYFIEPVLASHDHINFEIFCYMNFAIQDKTTERMQKYSDHWRNISRIPDKKMVELIRKDKIDILIDLAGHTENNRILLLACKPAPVQVSWIGYPATTSLSTIDYKLVDNHTDPPGITERFYTEKLIRMPESFLCYLPNKDSPQVNDLPAFTRGHITFGSFNNFSKVSPEIIDIWGKILISISNSHLIIKAKSLGDTTTRQDVKDIFKQKGISAERIKLLSWVTSAKEHLELYNEIDIGLDTFPYNGTTTTCEALWMGVPIITFAGDTHVSRVGVSLLSNVGLSEFIAKTFDEYIAIAVNLAKDLKRLQSLRVRLRNMMLSSPLCDAKRFTLNLEMCYRKMWETWCKSV